ncbi:MAG: hypothetical protein COA77_05375 [Thaumarchaeota archaeon]|nr:MAG: hypothetical protein COA77_09555 [Nitrososphaerota archaeon]PBO85287.1 MAG: hypothetical protein COA77_05375 [Nitrososphaerota archaeon]
MVKTPADKWKDTVIKYRKQCQSILKISKNIRYAGVINVYGRTLTGIVNPKLKPLLKSEQVKNEFFILSTLMSLRKDTVNSVGKLEHVILQHQKVIILILQKNDMTFYISINRSERGIEKLITLIKKVI